MIPRSWSSYSTGFLYGFAYQISNPIQPTLTKRNLLSIISQIYDPLGFIGLVITKAKLMLQLLWKSKIDWDQELSPELLSVCDASEKASYSTGFLYGFAYQISNPIQPTLTKRNLLSIISQIYDPLGFIGLVITKAKLMLQLLWKSKIDWDQELSPELLSVCDASEKAYGTCLVIRSTDSLQRVQVHVFSDASEKAYGTCLVIRSTDSLQRVQVKLVCSKSRVAPLKLCRKVLNAFKCKINSTTYWCDSTTVLAWISTDVSRLKTFISSRVSKIHTFSKPSQWRYLPSNEHPADVISRGLNPDQTSDCTLWFERPTWLTLEPNFSPLQILLFSKQMACQN
ncbi:Pao retrotransposon peptidase [Popillia japonica]|uniref:Pao retrotransposon peptidase n=1 Tax=Popillia japonica TaxID=7064 RepID=A0AAW1K541_POPJA